MSVKTKPVGEHQQRNDRTGTGDQSERDELAMSPQAQERAKGQKSRNREISAGRYANAGQLLSLRRSHMAPRSFDQHFMQLFL